jgi:hypothetical protein
VAYRVLVEAWRRPAVVVGPVERAVALVFVLRDVGNGEPFGLEDVADGLLEVFYGVSSLGGGDAGIAQRQRRFCMAHGGVDVLVHAGDVAKAGDVSLPGGAARLVEAVVVVILLETVEGASPWDALLALILRLIGMRVQSNGVRVVPVPILLDLGEPGDDVSGVRAVTDQACSAQSQHALDTEVERETMSCDVVFVEFQGCEFGAEQQASKSSAACLREVARCRGPEVACLLA